MKKSACPVCQSPALTELESDGGPMRCCRCGDFVVMGTAASRLTEFRPNLGAREMALLSGWLREHWGSTLEARDIDQILELCLPTVGEKAERVLLHLGRVFPSGGEYLDLQQVSADRRASVVSSDWSEEYLGRNVTTDLALEAVGFCHGSGELCFLLLVNVHFDNRQYNFILWQEDKLDELQRRLALRIEATLGHGPLP